MHRVSSLLWFSLFLYISQCLGDKDSKISIKQISISDATVVISDSADSQDVAEGRKYRPEFPNAVDSKVTAEHFHHLTFTFKLKNQGTGKAVQPHQVFTSIGNSKDEVVYPANYDGKQFLVHFSFEEVANVLHKSGDFSLSLTVGDISISTPIQWKVATIHISFPNKTSFDVPNPFAPKPEIAHMFRLPESRPKKTVSLAFTAAVLSPALFLFIGLIRVGANLSNFPVGSGFIWAVGFQACFGAILALFVLYWLALNMVQTLIYLGVLSVPTILFAQKTLNNLAAQNKLKKA